MGKYYQQKKIGNKDFSNLVRELLASLLTKVIIHKSGNFYGTEIEIWTGFRTEKNLGRL